MNGSLDRCLESDFKREISCDLTNCEKVYGNWTDVGSCMSDGDKTDCGPGKQNKTRLCEDGTIDKFVNAEKFQVVVCRLPDCSKELGEWNTSGPCESETNGKYCGPGIQKLTRVCTDGTSDKCSDDDVMQDSRCSLSDCPMEVGQWESAGQCESSGDYRYCGKGQIRQIRQCTNGTTDFCTHGDTERYIECNLPSCFIDVGDWSYNGTCVGTGDNKKCGPGHRIQTRSCTDGAISNCSSADIRRLLPCSLPDCSKELGNWTNEGECIGFDGKDCGPGNQLQTRTCVDGTNIQCEPTEMARTQKCNLPHCKKILGSWDNIGECVASGSNKNCGQGQQYQRRSCIDGTIDKCTEQDRQHAISCSLRDCPKRLGPWTDVGKCLAADADNPCGPGTQMQTRRCTDGTNDKCESGDTERTVQCELPKCPGISRA